MRTGAAVPCVKVRPKFLNFRGEGVLTDSKGRLTLPVRAESGVDGILVDDTRYAGLFGNVVGREGHGFRPGDRDDNVIVPRNPGCGTVRQSSRR